MISCTEFIPLYSEFFHYLERAGGHDAVLEYWYYIADKKLGDVTNPNSLKYKCEKYGGFKGAIKYWEHTLTEEACDLFQVNDLEKGYMYQNMRWCPSRGRLNSFTHIEPYYDYCEHCNVIYQAVLKNYGVVYERDHSDIDKAQCAALLYKEGNKPPYDIMNITEADIDDMKKSATAEIIDMKSGDNKYLHRDFHISCDAALLYCGDKFGIDGLRDFLTTYTKNFYAPVIKEVKSKGMEALKTWIEKTYELEEAGDVVHTEIADNKLTVIIDECPAIAFMKTVNQKPCKYFDETTKTLYKVIAEECGMNFDLEYYNENGATKFAFAFA